MTDALAGVTAHTARARPIGGGHSIWEIALHIGAHHDAYHAGQIEILKRATCLT